jgi:hypothetical protein
MPKSLSDAKDISTVLSNISTFLVNGGTIIGTLFAIGGTSATLVNSSFAFSVSFDGANLPLRLTIFTLMSGTLGWGLGIVVQRLSLARTEGLRMICYLAAVVWAGLLVGTADWIAPEKRGVGFPERQLFTLIGMGIIFQLSMFQFRTTSPTVPLGVTRIRCDALLLLAVATLFVLVLTEVGNV